MSDTSILVTPCGGLATVLTFLRPGATAIAMNYWQTIQQRSLQLEDNYYRQAIALLMSEDLLLVQRAWAAKAAGLLSCMTGAVQRSDASRWLSSYLPTPCKMATPRTHLAAPACSAPATQCRHLSLSNLLAATWSTWTCSICQSRQRTMQPPGESLTNLDTGWPARRGAAQPSLDCRGPPLGACHTPVAQHGHPSLPSLAPSEPHCFPLPSLCSDRPECELVEGGPRPQDAHYPLLGSLVHCNLRLAPGGLLRLVRYVDAAMLRWAAVHGRYDVLPSPTQPLIATDGGESGGAESSSSNSSDLASAGQAAEAQSTEAQPSVGQQQQAPQAADAVQPQQREAEQHSGEGSRQRHRKQGGAAKQETPP